ncbi:MAG: YfhO family protein, partial [Candidatus Binatia bacterium]
LVGGAIVWQASARLPPPGATTLDSLERISWQLALGLPLLAAGAWRRGLAFARVGFSVLIVIELAQFSLAYMPRSTDERRLFPPPRFVSKIPRSIAPPRIAAINSGRPLLLPNSLIPFGIAEIGGYSSLIQGDNSELVRRINLYADPELNRAMPRIRNAYSPLIDLAGIEYLAATEPLETGDGRLELVDFAEDVYLYRNHRAAPRAFIVAKIVARDRTGDWRRLSVKEFSHCRYATLRLPDDTPERRPIGREGCVGSATITEYAPNRVEIHALTPVDGLLVLTDSHFPGWRATVDGVEQPVEKVDGAFRGVRLQAGEHRVRFEFRPVTVLRGAAISLAAMMIAALLVLLGIAANRRRAAESSPIRPAS